MRLGALYLHGGPPELFTLAPHIEGLGFSRLWIAENQPQASAMLTAGIAAGSAALAAKHGLAFAYSDFHTMSTRDPSIAKRYREEFQPCWAQRQHEVIVATAGVCAETDELAERLAAAWPNKNHLPRII